MGSRNPRAAKQSFVSGHYGWPGGYGQEQENCHLCHLMSHFQEGKSRDQRGGGTCSESHSRSVVE